MLLYFVSVAVAKIGPFRFETMFPAFLQTVCDHHGVHNLLRTAGPIGSHPFEASGLMPSLIHISNSSCIRNNCSFFSSSMVCCCRSSCSNKRAASGESSSGFAGGVSFFPPALRLSHGMELNNFCDG